MEVLLATTLVSDQLWRSRPATGQRVNVLLMCTAFNLSVYMAASSCLDSCSTWIKVTSVKQISPEILSYNENEA